MIEIVNVLVATVVAFGLGAVWYNVLSKPWMEAAGIECGPDGQPAGGMDPKLLVFGFICQLVVAGMMRHVFALGGIDTLGKGIVAGAGIGLFLIAPWTALNNAYGGKPFKLSVIDGGYATLACAVMGLILVLF